MSPTVAILLGTYNGEAFLAEQLSTFEQQIGCEWKLYASDDGSDDATLDILESFHKSHPGRVTLLHGPTDGFAANFISLVQNDDIDADYFAYADQDDLWLKDKLSCAIQALATLPKDVPALYCSRTAMIDENGAPSGYSPQFRRPPSFNNALVQNIAGGNTMLFNRPARAILKSGRYVPGLGGHDWWTYLLLSACGGKVVYDPQPRILYRQHNTNLIGRNSGFLAKLRRIQMMLSGRYQNWNTSNLEALSSITDKISPPHKRTLDLFRRARYGSITHRLRSLHASGAYRQTRLGNLGLYLACLLNRI